VAWPRRHDVWRAAAVPAKKAFTDVILAINRFEPVTVLVPSDLVRASVSVWAGCNLGCMLLCDHIISCNPSCNWSKPGTVVVPSDLLNNTYYSAVLHCKHCTMTESQKCGSWLPPLESVTTLCAFRMPGCASRNTCPATVCVDCPLRCCAAVAACSGWRRVLHCLTASECCR
jgi:hypothetical protein